MEQGIQRSKGWEEGHIIALMSHYGAVLTASQVAATPCTSALWTVLLMYTCSLKRSFQTLSLSGVTFRLDVGHAAPFLDSNLLELQ